MTLKKLPSKYLEFIEECKLKSHDMTTHRHHIIPRFMGGTDDESNYVTLNVTDHFEAHKILAENISIEYEVGAWASLNLLKRYWIGDYDEIRDKISKSVTGEKNGMYGKHHTISAIEKIRRAESGSNNHFYGKHHTDETKEILSLKLSKWLGDNGSPFKGKTHKPDTIEKIRQAVIDHQHNNGHPCLRKCIDNETNKSYNSIKDMAYELGIPKSTMSGWIRNEKKTRFNYK